jgi:hypothetical protein
MKWYRFLGISPCFMLFAIHQSWTIPLEFFKRQRERLAQLCLHLQTTKTPYKDTQLYGVEFFLISRQYLSRSQILVFK